MSDVADCSQPWHFVNVFDIKDNGTGIKRQSAHIMRLLCEIYISGNQNRFQFPTSFGQLLDSLCLPCLSSTHAHPRGSFYFEVELSSGSLGRKMAPTDLTSSVCVRSYFMTLTASNVSRDKFTFIISTTYILL